MDRKLPPGALQEWPSRFGALGLLRLLRAGARARGIRMLFTHRVLDDAVREDEDWARACGHITRREFDRRVSLLVRRFRPVSLDRCLELLSKREPLCEDYFVLTLDDGYADNLRNACPVLRRYQVPATFFVCTGAIGTPSLLWMDQLYQALARTERKVLAADWLDGNTRLGNLKQRMVAGRRLVRLLKRLPARAREERQADLLHWLGGAAVASEGDRMLTWDEVRQIARDPLFSVGVHTISRPVLTSVDPDGARREIQGSADELAGQVGQPCSHFAYPNGKEGDFTPSHVELLRRAGLRSACTTMAGINLRGSDAYRLSRVPLAPSVRLGHAVLYPRQALSSVNLRIGILQGLAPWVRPRCLRRSQCDKGHA